MLLAPPTSSTSADATTAPALADALAPATLASPAAPVLPAAAGATTSVAGWITAAPTEAAASMVLASPWPAVDGQPADQVAGFGALAAQPAALPGGSQSAAGPDLGGAALLVGGLLVLAGWRHARR